jgi:hypothetical protein
VSDEPRLVRFLVGSGSIEELLQQKRREEQEAPDDEQIEVTFAVGEWMPALELADMLDRECQQSVEDTPEPQDD